MSTISSGTTTTTGYVVTSDTTGQLVIKTGSGATTALTIDASQNVSFNGNVSLSTPLTIGAGSAAAPSIAPTGDPNTGMFFPAADTIGFSEGGTEVLRINSSGQVEFIDGTVSLPAITNSGDTNTGIFFPTAGTIAFAEGGTEALRITSTGAIAVNGAANYGNSGQVLTSNGNAPPSWQAAASGAQDYIVQSYGIV